MLNGIRGLLFDLDGTLVDSMWMWKQIDIDFLGGLGLALPGDLQEIIQGMSFSETAVYFKDRFRLNMGLEEIKRIWTEMSIEKYRKEVPFKPAAEEFLKEARKAGMKTGIATSNGLPMVEAALDSLDLRQYLDAVVTACEVSRGKPFPDIYLKTAEYLGVIPEKCLVFEDIPEGIIAGKRAGMTVCAVRDDFSADQESRKALLSDWMISDYRELLKN